MKSRMFTARASARVVLRASVATVALASASSAYAQCAPEPTQANGTTICAGTDADGLTVTTYGTAVSIPSGASVSGGSDAAIAVKLPSTDFGSPVSITVGGSVDGGANPGVTLFWQSPPSGFSFNNANLNLKVDAGGSVLGTTALTVGNPSGGFQSAIAAIDNAGTLTGAGGIALLSTTPANSGFSHIINRATGSIGAINAPFGLIDNAGTIDGGSNSAIEMPPFTSVYLGERKIQNSGTITASSSSATIKAGHPISNSGSISNTGSGAAVESDSINLTNTATGTISSIAGSALRSSTGMTLVNAGIITGNVETAFAAPYTTGSTVDSSLGSINGNVTFGAGSDVLVARYSAGAVRIGITGTIDGGLGADTERVNFDSDATVTSPIILPTSFEKLAFAPLAGSTVTLAAGFSGSYPIYLEGDGTIVNQTALSSSGAVFAAECCSFGHSTLINDGTIATVGASSGTYAVNFSSAYDSFINGGAVSSDADGVRFTTQGLMSNSGSITASGTAIYYQGTGFKNSGQITSTAGIGAELGGSYGASLSLSNSGTISGITGVILSSGLNNTGTISGQATGVMLQSYGIIDNRSSGIISGLARAIDASTNSTVVNAGTINGDVRVSGASFITFNASRYFALPGGILNGNLELGPNTVLIAELAGSSGDAFAGINGTVSASQAILRYRVRQDLTSSLTAPAGFSGVGFDLSDGAKLSLSGTSTLPLYISGQGSLSLTGDISVAKGSAIVSDYPLRAPDEPTIATQLAITSSGNLSVIHTDPASFAVSVVSLGADSFTNLGTISAFERATSANQVVAISNGTVVTNAGTIALDAGIGVAGAQEVVNGGKIYQIAGGKASTGVIMGQKLTNTGVIEVDATAVRLGSYSSSIVNSGRIVSASGTAIASSSGASSFLSLVNGSSGLISSGGGNPAIRAGSGEVTNAGSIVGAVDLGYSDFGRSFSAARYTTAGGTIAGDLMFGSGADLFVSLNGAMGVSGKIDGGLGTDTAIFARNSSGDVTPSLANFTNFEQIGVRALGAGTVVTIQSPQAIGTSVYLSGDGQIVNNASIIGNVLGGLGSFVDPDAGLLLSSFVNKGTISGSFSGDVKSFTNSGQIGTVGSSGSSVTLTNAEQIKFDNSGTLNGSVGLTTTKSIDTVNSGMISGAQGIGLQVRNFTGVAGTVTVNNSGQVTATSAGGDGLSVGVSAGSGSSVSIVNSGAIRANAGGLVQPIRSNISEGILATNSLGQPITITNAASGIVEATGTLSSAIVTSGSALDLTNAGAITGNNGTSLAATDANRVTFGPTLAGAVHTLGGFADRIVNTGTITGSINLGGGNDRVENRGSITGDVALGLGDDTFLQLASALIKGTVDGGVGIDTLIVDATGGGTVNGDQFVNFEAFNQVGQGTVTYSGAFTFDTIGIGGSTVVVSQGQTVGTSGGTTFTGGSGDETVINSGTISGSVSLADGNDRVVNNGTIGGSVLLGAGNDTYVDGPGSRVGGSIDGGDGIDLYSVTLSGNRSGISGRSGFERLALEGSGTLSLNLDQSFTDISMSGAGLDLVRGSFSVGSISGSGLSETVSLDRDVSSVSLGEGNDALTLPFSTISGNYDGGAGSDLLRLSSSAPVVLLGSATGFENIELPGGMLTVGGTLGTTGNPLSFGAGDQQLLIGRDGILRGNIDLGAGNDRFQFDSLGTLSGTVAGGAGTDAATLITPANFTLGAGVLTGFESLATRGGGTLTLTGAQAFDVVTSGGNLTIAANGSLVSQTVGFGATNDTFTVGGGFSGSADGGAGTDALLVSSGSASAPVAFGSVTNFESFGLTGGYTSIAGTASFGTIDMSGGRLVGLAGSTITIPQILVRNGVTFGSAGTVNGNITVAGTLSPGASPGTMTVNGNVVLQSGSLSLFEITPTVSDRLLVNGSVSISSGATLQLITTGAVQAGTSYDLIVASGGITGAFTSILKPDTLFGFIVQRADRIQLLGQFLSDPSYSPQVGRSIAYANATVATQTSNSALFGVLPSLVMAGGASNQLAFAQLTPEAYASASQAGVSDALSLADTARGPALATSGDTPHPFTFVQGLGNWNRFDAEPAQGVSKAKGHSYGVLGGLGYGSASASVGGFVGYLDSRQHIATLGADTRADGLVAGIHGRIAAASGLGISASLVRIDANADTTRPLVTTATGSGSYDLSSWTADVSAGYDVALAGDWLVRPSVGVTYSWVTRGAVNETSGGPLALTVAKDGHKAGFVDAGLSFGRSPASTAAVKPFGSLAGRYQFAGRQTDAIAGYSGGTIGLQAFGPARDRLTGLAKLGVEARASDALDVYAAANARFGGEKSEQVAVGIKLAF